MPLKPSLRTLWLVVLLISFPSCSSVNIGSETMGAETDLAWRMGTSGKIPKGYDTYTLFINTSYEYADQDGGKKIDILNHNFKRFADSIGPKNLAIWVNEPDSNSLSVSRGKFYADLFSKELGKSLEYYNGPYIILTDRYPEDLGKAGTEDGAEAPIIISVGFNKIGKGKIIELLNYLEARIRRADLSRNKTNLHILAMKMQTWWNSEDSQTFLKNVFLTVLAKK